MARHVNSDYQIVCKWYILGIVPVFTINFTREKWEKLRLKEKIRSVDFQSLEKDLFFDKALWNIVKEFPIMIKNIHLAIEIGTENASLTSIIVPAISTIVAILLRKRMHNLNDQVFTINPIFQNQNLVNIYISGIFELKMRHIIHIMYMLKRKKGKGVKEYERTSHRGTYDYSYE